MAERRKNKKKKEVDVKLDDKPSKEEYAVAKYLKQTLPEKKTTLLGHKVEYFIGSKAVDCLADSQWAKENKKGELNFSNRDIAVDFMARLLEHKFFHRAKKIVVQKEPKKKKKEVEEAAQDSGVEKEKESKKSSKKAKSDNVEKVEEKDTPKEKDIVEKKKEKKKIKLDMHLEQFFIDSNEPYVWIYDPIPLRTWITGTLMVVAAVLLCLFPLWPQTIRHYIYYLSVAAACFLVFIIGLAVLRLVVFVLVWIVTFGKHHLWLLPNLTEDVGFFESFWPLYHYEYKGSKEKKVDTKEKSSKGVEKKVEEEDNNKEESQGEEEEEEKNNEHSQSESEKSEGEAQKTDNGFEFLEAEEGSATDEQDEDRKTK